MTESFPMIYDTRFDQIVIETAEATELSRNRLIDVVAAGIPRENYHTLGDLEEAFMLSRYQLKKLMIQVDAQPFGELITLDKEGNRGRGVGKVVYHPDVMDELRELAGSEIDVAAIKTNAEQMLSQ